MEVYSWEHHPFLWAMASMAMLNNQRVHRFFVDDVGADKFLQILMSSKRYIGIGSTQMLINHGCGGLV